MSKKIWPLIICLMILALVAATALAFTTEQAERGKILYANHCAVCHGADGRGGTVPERFGKMAGTKASPVAGPRYLPKMKTAGQAYEFAKKNMPADKPGSLKEAEYLDIISFALMANGIKADGKALTPASAEEIKLAGGGM